MSDVVSLPTAGVTLDLDAQERPPEEIKSPYVVKVGDRLVTFIDPAEADWRDLIHIGTPADLFAVALNEDDATYIRGRAMEGWRFNILMKGYYDYYGLEDKIREAQRQAKLSGL